MNEKVTIELSEADLFRARKRAQEEGFDSLGAYVDALIHDDLDSGAEQDWIRERLREGLESGDAGPLTKEKVQRLVSEGIARAKPRA